MAVIAVIAALEDQFGISVADDDFSADLRFGRDAGGVREREACSALSPRRHGLMPVPILRRAVRA